MFPLDTTIDILQVRHTRLDAERIEYTYTLYPAYQPPQSGSRALRHQTSRAQLEKMLLDAATDIRLIASGSQLPAGPSFHRLGNTLREKYLPDQVLAFLFAEPPAPLLIDTDDPEFPWEVVHDGSRFLGAYRPLGRRLPDQVQVRTRPAHWGDARQAMLVQLLPESFEASKQEIASIAGILSTYDCAAHWNLDTEHFKTALQQCPELLHCISHVTYHQHQRNASALVCADGGHLTASMIQAFTGTYAMVYIDGCEGARAGIPSVPPTLPKHLGDFTVIRSVEGLAAAFLAGGAVVFVSALWPIVDTLAANFSEAVYQQLARGVPIGEALRWTREQFLNERAGDPTWASYILYGDPRQTLATIHDPTLPLQAVTPAHGSVPVVPMQLGAMRFRSPRVELFVRQYLVDAHATLAPAVIDALHETIRLIDSASRSQIYRLDLLAGLAAVPESLCARALQALHYQPDAIALYALHLLERGESARDLPSISHGVKAVFERAQQAVRQSGRTAITELDLLAILLSPASGSVKKALQMLTIDPKAFLAIIRQIEQTNQVPELLPPRAMAVRSEVHDADKHSIQQDRAPNHLLVNLREEIAEQVADNRLPPFLGRLTETLAIMRALTRSDHHHALLIGPAGIGKYALAYHIAALALTQPNDSSIAAIASWQMYALRLNHSSPRADDDLRKKLNTIATASILLLEDLSAFVQVPGILPIIERLVRHHQIRLIATVTPSDLSSLERQHFDLVDAFLPFELTPPSPKEATVWIATHIPSLEARYAVSIGQGCLEAALDCAQEDFSLVLPGSALERLDLGCTNALLREYRTSALGEHSPARSIIPVTPADISTAGPALFVKGDLA